MASEDPLNRLVVEQMPIGVATWRYARSLEPLPATMITGGTSKNAVSRRFVAKTAAQLEAGQSQPLDRLDLVGRLVDGVQVGEHCLDTAGTSSVEANIFPNDPARRARFSTVEICFASQSHWRKQPKSLILLMFGAGEWTRTTDLLITNYELALSELSAIVRGRSPCTGLRGELILSCSPSFATVRRS
jgi:hypothetical protein